ncbi:expansin-like A2 [Momordica charantia]|uniref:Expansin-like A2 n=1 Tax=Momordica charantia TaxID=3673 RepID=A0A6J1C3K4_MOMCH|nr:expansin-like A2 [Momordica charantia]
MARWFLFFFLVSFATACDRCVHRSKATHYYGDSPTSYGGACGYGNLALEFTNGYFAAAVPSLYKQGVGCGACFQVRCKDKRLCNTAGTKVVLTDQNYDTRTDFVLSRKAFSAMSLKGKDQDLLNSGIVDIEYKRIPCAYKNKNLSVRVEESSYNPQYLAIKVLYQGGQTEIVAVDIAEVGSYDWVSLKRNYGAVWDTNKVPKGALKMRIAVTAGYDGKWLWSNYVLPADWKNGMIYDTRLQIDDIAKESCPPSQCGDAPWK